MKPLKERFRENWFWFGCGFFLIIESLFWSVIKDRSLNLLLSFFVIGVLFILTGIVRMLITEKKNNQKEPIASTLSDDDFLLRLLDGAHTAIFQWVTVWLASGIGVVQIIIEVLKSSRTPSSSRIIYGFIYLFLIFLMTMVVHSILNAMHHQNKWINRLSDETKKKLFYESRSRFSALIVGEKEKSSVRGYLLIVSHFLLLLIFGKVVWLLAS